MFAFLTLIRGASQANPDEALAVPVFVVFYAALVAGGFPSTDVGEEFKLFRTEDTVACDVLFISVHLADLVSDRFDALFSSVRLCPQHAHPQSCCPWIAYVEHSLPFSVFTVDGPRRLDVQARENLSQLRLEFL